MQYMDGTFPIHIAMAIYCIDEYQSNLSFFSECRSKLSDKYDYGDILFMLIAHVIGMMFVLTTSLRQMQDAYSYL